MNITQPTQKLPIQIKLLEESGLVFSSKININKNQTLTLNYDPPPLIKTMYNQKWDAESIKYLGVSLPRDFTILYNITCGPLNSKIKPDTLRWNFTAVLSLCSRKDQSV